LLALPLCIVQAPQQSQPSRCVPCAPHVQTRSTLVVMPALPHRTSSGGVDRGRHRGPPVGLASIRDHTLSPPYRVRSSGGRRPVLYSAAPLVGTDGSMEAARASSRRPQPPTGAQVNLYVISCLQGARCLRHPHPHTAAHSASPDAPCTPSPTRGTRYTLHFFLFHGLGYPFIRGCAVYSLQ
jgi:hypothetical protein